MFVNIKIKQLQKHERLLVRIHFKMVLKSCIASVSKICGQKSVTHLFNSKTESLQEKKNSAST